MINQLNLRLFFVFLTFFLFLNPVYGIDLNNNPSKKKIFYITDEIKFPFWSIMGKGIESNANRWDYNLEIYSSAQSKKNELKAILKAIKEKVDGIIISPTNSTSCVTVLKLAKKANIPVVISDIGADSGEYVSYISSDNLTGAYNVGKHLAKTLIDKGHEKGQVGIIAIPQKRLNGKQRTQGFKNALTEFNIKAVSINQVQTWSDDESYRFTEEMIKKYKNLSAIWIQTSIPYNGVLKALKDHNKSHKIFFAAFDAEKEFLELIPNNTIVATGMQQPYLMGQTAMEAMHKHLSGKPVDKNIQIPILAVNPDNINDQIEVIKRNVFGIE